MLHKASEIRGFQLEARDGTIGKIKDLLFDDESWTIRYLVANTGRWLPGRRVLLSPASAVTGALDRDGSRLPMDLTKAQIEHSPGEETDQPVSAQFQQELHSYYGWPVYWGLGPYPMTGVLPPTRSEEPGSNVEADRKSAGSGGDPHLRSSEQVRGYGIHAMDGEIGHVEEFLVDVDAWIIRAIVIDTRNWLPGKKVVVTPEVIDRVSWTDSTVAVRLTLEEIKSSPEYSADVELPADFSDRLASYYGEMMTSRR